MPSKAKKKSKQIKPNCWKVLDSERGSMFAIGELYTKYPVGEKVQATVGGLLAFRSKKLAQTTLMYGRILVPAIGKGKIQLPKCRDLDASRLRNARRVWKGVSVDLEIDGWLEGTVAYKELTCIK